jgi:hypothetical protein
MDRAMPAGRLQTDQPHHAVTDAVEERDRVVEEPLEEVERDGHPERGRLGALQRDTLRGEFAEDDVEGRRDGERDDQRHRVGADDRLGTVQKREAREQGVEQGGDRGFSDEAEPERGHRDPELRGGDVGVEVFEGAVDLPRAGTPLVGQLLHPGLADADERELGGDEEAVQQDEPKHRYQAQECGTDRIVHPSAFTRTLSSNATPHAPPRFPTPLSIYVGGVRA